MDRSPERGGVPIVRDPVVPSTERPSSDAVYFVIVAPYGLVARASSLMTDQFWTYASYVEKYVVSSDNVAEVNDGTTVEGMARSNETVFEPMFVDPL